VARRDTLETQMKTIKTDFGSKLKVVIDKSENDDRLIAMLRTEIVRLENAKGIKSNLKTEDDGLGIELAKARRELAELKNTVKCQEIKIE
jgi:hypothetical protein